MRHFGKIKKLTSEYFKISIDQLSESTIASDVPGWDSLAHADFLIFLEQKFLIEFDLSDLMNMNKLGDLEEIIEKKLAR